MRGDISILYAKTYTSYTLDYFPYALKHVVLYAGGGISALMPKPIRFIRGNMYVLYARGISALYVKTYTSYTREGASPTPLPPRNAFFFPTSPPRKPGTRSKATPTLTRCLSAFYVLSACICKCPFRAPIAYIIYKG